MREGPSSEVLSGAAGWRPVLTSRLDGRVLASRIPITSGRLVTIADAEVPERLTFTVPEWDHGTSWVPESPTHPLARYGQIIEAQIQVTAPTSRIVTDTRLGLFRVHDWDFDDEGQVQVVCLGQLQRVKEAKFRSPEVPRAGGTFFSEFRRLMVPGIPVVIHPDLVDRPIPKSFVWETERLAALYEIAAALPARIRTDQWGQVNLLPPLPDVPAPVMTLTDGEGGTLIRTPRSDTRDQAYNVVVGQSSATDSPARESVRAVAEQLTGPMAATTDGTGYGEVVRYVSSPLTTTPGQVAAMAHTTLRSELRKAQVRTVYAAADPRVELDDALALRRGRRRARRTEWGWVVGTDLPLTVADGAMRLDVGVSA
ncbi:hypothetical protein GXB85_04730 [Cellulomonas sp. APG4]|uniref:hypothetical protein n=1 Tax=Cellulomonas sp. APG4 TaxID=1538656 RepID=UPI0013794265|nr:hypothetical protein [Cellulomonas sp. APG4]NCT90259.1 hypothetical protein [Cellulomonas sp. APG4]